MDNIQNFLALNALQTNLIEKQTPSDSSKTSSDSVQIPWRQILYKIYDNINNISSKNKKNSNSLTQQQSEPSSQQIDFKCKCKKTKCLKLYCECFSKGLYCKNCNCQCCNNLPQFDQVRSTVIDQIIQKNPNAFDVAQKTKKNGCICKKTGCLKKYCQCYNLGKKCGEECKCINCQNCM